MKRSAYAPEGVRHATINGHRFHLRLADPTEESFLWIDGRSPPLVLDPVAAEFTGHLIDAMWEHQRGTGDESDRVKDQVVERMFARHGGRILRKGPSRKSIRADLDRVFGTLLAVAQGGCPVEAGLRSTEIREERWSAPARLDLALTYRCNLDCGHCYAGGPHETEELALDDWRRILEAIWRTGVPQIVFTGGEPTLRDDLVDLVRSAEEFVTGLVTNGVRLEALAEPLHAASLDYAQVTLESSDPAVHDRMVGGEGAHARTLAGIRRALDVGMEIVTNTTVTRENAAGFADTLKLGRELGLSTMACNALICSGRGRAAKAASGLPLDELKTVLRDGVEAARGLGVDLQWYTPTCYRELNPLELGFGAKSCSAAAHNMTVQPDGTVLPCQSWPEPVGHILDDAWPTIWEHEACLRLRRREWTRERDECVECEMLPVCGGGCPLEPRGEEA